MLDGNFKRACPAGRWRWYDRRVLASRKRFQAIHCGESGLRHRIADEFLAHVEEGLGTLNLVADAMLALTGRLLSQHRNRHRRVDRQQPDATGAVPVSRHAHSGGGFRSGLRIPAHPTESGGGFAPACRIQRLCGAAAGDIPESKGIVHPENHRPGGIVCGRIQPKSRRVPATRSNVDCRCAAGFSTDVRKPTA